MYMIFFGKMLNYAFLARSIVVFQYFYTNQPGISEFQQVNADLKRYFFSATDATFILAAIFGICGALRIYYNMQMGKNKFTADVSAWFLAALFMILMGPFLRALFGL